MNGTPLGALVWQRFALSFILVLPLLHRQPSHAPTPPAEKSLPRASSTERRRWWADAGLACCMTTYYICATAGFALGPIALTSLIIALTPAITLAWQLAVDRRVAPRELGGFAVAVVGVAAYFAPLLSGTSGFGRRAVLVATLAATLATVGRAVYMILLWHRASNAIPLHPDRINRMTFAFGTLILLPVFFAQADGVVWSWRQFLTLVGLVVFATLAPNLLNTWASSRIAPGANAIIGMLTPPATGLLGWFFLAESLTATQWLGMALTLFGVAISTFRPMSTWKHRQTTAEGAERDRSPLGE
jgi:Predicted permease, DMT superfamily